MSTIKNVKIQRYIAKYGGLQSKIIDYRKYNRSEFKLVFVDDKTGVQRASATNIPMFEQQAHYYFK